MGISSLADKKPLLDDAEQNIGNSDNLRPQAGLPTTIPQTNPPRLLQLNGGSASGQTTSIVVTASRLGSQLNPNPGYAGPIAGIVEFGNGGRSTRAEFDVPIGPFRGSVVLPEPNSEPQDGGVIITVPTGVLRVYTRYDNLLLAPLLNQPADTTMADQAGVARQGPGGPVTVPAVPNPVVFPAEPVMTKAMAAYFSRHFSRAYKTLYCYVGAPGVAGITASSGGPGTIVPAFYALPAFAKTIQIQRMPMLSADLSVVLYNGINAVDQFLVPAGAPSPIVNVPGHVNVISIVSIAPADLITFLAILCEVGI